MAEISAVSFERFQIEDSGDWHELQWEQSKVVFDSFYEYLQEKGLKESTAARKTNMVVVFVMNFLFIYIDEIDNILYVAGEVIKVFLGNWYIRKSINPTTKEINQFLTALSDFYTFLYKKEFISKLSLDGIKEACKDKEWFADRLKSYYESEGDDFEDWLMDYNYEPF